MLNVKTILGAIRSVREQRRTFTSPDGSCCGVVDPLAGTGYVWTTRSGWKGIDCIYRIENAPTPEDGSPVPGYSIVSYWHPNRSMSGVRDCDFPLAEELFSKILGLCTLRGVTSSHDSLGAARKALTRSVQARLASHAAATGQPGIRPGRWRGLALGAVLGGLAVIFFSLAVTSVAGSAASGGTAVSSADAAAIASRAGLGPVDFTKTPTFESMSPAQQAALVKIASASLGLPPPVTNDAGTVQPPEGQDRLSATQRAQVVAAATVDVHGGAGGKELLVFEDPLCHSCKDFAAQTASLPADVRVRVIPIGFQPGGKEAASKALCASGDKVFNWRQTMSGMATGSETCPAGDKVIAQNNALFLGLGFTATPVLVAPNGAVATGSPEASVVAEWLNRNLK